MVESDQPAVGDGDAVGIARQIGEHGLAGNSVAKICLGSFTTKSSR
jgi:hypothetical protein